MNWKFWTWAKEWRAREKRIRELEAKIGRQRKLLVASHTAIHSGEPAHNPSIRMLRDKISAELNQP